MTAKKIPSRAAICSESESGAAHCRAEGVQQAHGEIFKLLLR